MEAVSYLEDGTSTMENPQVFPCEDHPASPQVACHGCCGCGIGFLDYAGPGVVGGIPRTCERCKGAGWTCYDCQKAQESSCVPARA